MTGGALVRRAPPSLEPDRSPSRAAPALRAATNVAAAAQVGLGGRDAFTRRAVGAGRRRSRRNRHAPLRSQLTAFDPRLGARDPTNAAASTFRSRWAQPLRRQYPRGGRRRSHPRNIASRRTGPGAVGSSLGALLWCTAAEPWEAAVPSAAPTAWSSASSVACRPTTEASPSSAAAATSSSRTSSQTIALGVRAAFGDTPSATVGESWYGAHTTFSNQVGRRRADLCYPTNAALLYDRSQDRPSDAGARHERSSPSRRAGSVAPTS